MSEMGEMAFVAPEPEEPKEPKEIKDETIKIRFSLFFDGTCNNRTNTDHRLNVANEVLPEAERQASIAIYEKHQGDDSYENDYSNVAKMEKYINDAEGYGLTLKSYIEGPGTTDHEGDSSVGYGMGMGKSGVRNKVEQGLQDVINLIAENHTNKKTIIELLTLDVFGFSRGAAGARNFIHEALNGDKLTPVKTLLEEKGYQVGKVEVDFVGLYDTVSAHGVVYANDVNDLKLRAVRHAKRVVQLAAAEEHRKNFSLTTIQCAGQPKGREIFLPGVHSDIGGSYVDNSAEEQVVFHGPQWMAVQDREALIASGWYQPHEIDLIELPSGPHGLSINAMVTVKREGIRNHYSRIPLHIMANFARENAINIKTKLESANKIPGKLEGTKERIDNYIKNTPHSKSEHWQHNEGWLKALRNDYLHFSAKYEFGLGPRFKDGKRYRKQYAG